MSVYAANPAGFSHLSPCMVLQAISPSRTCNDGGDQRPSFGGHACSNRTVIAANFRSQRTDEDFVLERVCRYVSPPLFGHRFGAFHAPCGSSLFCFGCAALRVTVSLQILFGKYAEKIPPDPP